MLIQEGEYYRDKSGKVVGPMVRDYMFAYNYFTTNNTTGFVYQDDGRKYGHLDNTHDLISHVSKDDPDHPNNNVLETTYIVHGVHCNKHVYLMIATGSYDDVLAYAQQQHPHYSSFTMKQANVVDMKTIKRSVIQQRMKISEEKFQKAKKERQAELKSAYEELDRLS